MKILLSVKGKWDIRYLFVSFRSFKRHKSSACGLIFTRSSNKISREEKYSTAHGRRALITTCKPGSWFMGVSQWRPAVYRWYIIRKRSFTVIFGSSTPLTSTSTQNGASKTVINRGGAFVVSFLSNSRWIIHQRRLTILIWCFHEEWQTDSLFNFRETVQEMNRWKRRSWFARTWEVSNASVRWLSSFPLRPTQVWDRHTLFLHSAAVFERRGWCDERALIDPILSVHVWFTQEFDGASDCEDRKGVSLRPRWETFLDNRQLRRNMHRKIFYSRWWSKEECAVMHICNKVNNDRQHYSICDSRGIRCVRTNKNYPSLYGR